MQEKLTLQPIAYIRNDYTAKFGIPRQSGMVAQRAYIFFEREYQDNNALRGLEDYDYLWLLWGFHANRQGKHSLMVKPPRLGGNRRMGVFATRSPYRPNPIGLSSVRLESVEYKKGFGAILVVEGADLMDKTPIYDIKPYLAFTDSHPEARSGFAQNSLMYRLRVEFPQELLNYIPKEKQESLISVLTLDPRPAYQHCAEECYGLSYGEYDVRFHVKDGILTVFDVTLTDKAVKIK